MHICVCKGCRWVCETHDDQPWSGRVKSWLKIKNPKSPAALRIEEGTF
jgi:hypothetical protein